jgi:SAM-dependent methyltransferase
MIFKKFIPAHADNRMAHEGNLEYQRQYFLSKKNQNMNFLLSKRFEWMEKFIDSAEYGLEVGSGFGASKFFISNRNFILSDVGCNEWLDIPNCHAESIPIADGSLDFLIVNQTLHHLAFPQDFFDEARRVLRPGGRVIMLEPFTSLVMKLVLIVMRHEGFDDSVNPLDRTIPMSDPNDPWSANNSMVRLLFQKEKLGSGKIPGFALAHSDYVEFLTFLNSGGVGSKFFYLPLPSILLRLQWLIDKFLTKLLPKVFALQMQIVLVKGHE